MLRVCFKITQFLDSVQTPVAQSSKASPRLAAVVNARATKTLNRPRSNSPITTATCNRSSPLRKRPCRTKARRPQQRVQRKHRRRSGGVIQKASEPRHVAPATSSEEGQDDCKSSPLQGTADTNTTGEEAGTYSFTLHPTSNIARTLQLRDTSHSRALLYPRSAPYLAPSIASSSDWSLVSEAIRQAEAFDDDESPDSIAALLWMIANYSDVTAQAKVVFKASRLVHPAWLLLLLNPFLILLTRGSGSLYRKTSPDRNPVNKNDGRLPDKETEAHASPFYTGRRSTDCATSRRSFNVLQLAAATAPASALYTT